MTSNGSGNGAGNSGPGIYESVVETMADGVFVLDPDGTIAYVNGAVENVLYRQWKALVAWEGLVQFLRGDTSWGEMTRAGLKR